MNLIKTIGAVVALIALLVIVALLWSGPPGSVPVGPAHLQQAVVVDGAPPGFVVPVAVAAPLNETANTLNDTSFMLNKPQDAVCAGEEGRAAQSAWYEASELRFL